VLHYVYHFHTTTLRSLLNKRKRVSRPSKQPITKLMDLGTIYTLNVQSTAAAQSHISSFIFSKENYSLARTTVALDRAASVFLSFPLLGMYPSICTALLDRAGELIVVDWSSPLASRYTGLSGVNINRLLPHRRWHATERRNGRNLTQRARNLFLILIRLGQATYVQLNHSTRHWVYPDCSGNKKTPIHQSP
jgi:hypothetical protein